MKGSIDRAEINKQGSCHLFRHTIVTLMLEHGVDIRYIQAILGHANISTTQMYTQVSIQKLKQVHTKTHSARLKIDNDRNAETEDALLALLTEEQKTE